MQLTASKLDQWFFPGPENKLLARDLAGTHEAIEIYNNLINPAVKSDASDNKSDSVTDATGYKSSERAALENQLLQLETVARAVEQRAESTDDMVTE
jgi:hypothetical protein